MKKLVKQLRTLREQLSVELLAVDAKIKVLEEQHRKVTLTVNLDAYAKMLSAQSQPQSMVCYKLCNMRGHCPVCNKDV